jgi:AraC-like DNA-binding protein
MKDFNLHFESEKLYFHHTCETAPRPRSYYRHNHTQYELYVFFEGAIDFVVEDKTYHMTPSTALLICPLAYHYPQTLREDTPYHRLVLDFDRTAVSPALRETLPCKTTAFLFDGSLFGSELTFLHHAIQSYTGEDKTLALHQFINRVLLYLRNTSKELSPSPDTANKIVNQILEYINGHIEEPLSVRGIAQALFHSPVYVSQLFSANMHIGIMDYVKHKKILLCKELIENGTKPTAAAAALGFAEYSTFYRLYRKYLNASPNDDTKK